MTVAESAEPLAPFSLVCKWVRVTVETAAGNLYIGSNPEQLGQIPGTRISLNQYGVDATSGSEKGMKILADETIVFENADLNEIWIDSSSASDDVTWMAEF